MKDGRVLCDKVEYPKGEPENPLSAEENLIKFLSMTEHAGIVEGQAIAVFNEIMQAQEPNFNVLW